MEDRKEKGSPSDDNMNEYLSPFRKSNGARVCVNGNKSFPTTTQTYH